MTESDIWTVEDAVPCRCAHALEDLSKEQLIELVEMSAKNLVALDGTWFQSIERECGMDEAMRHDERAWSRFTESERAASRRFWGWGSVPVLRGWLQHCATS